jgi:hypothetical protein
MKKAPRGAPDRVDEQCGQDQKIWARGLLTLASWA